MSVTTAKDANVAVYKDVMEKVIKPSISCAEICNGQSIKEPFHWDDALMVATSWWSHKGCDTVEAYEVIPRERYTGNLEPLPYSEHWAAADRKERDRGYTGMLVKKGKQEYVMGEKAVFTSTNQNQQGDLFS